MKNGCSIGHRTVGRITGSAHAHDIYVTPSPVRGCPSAGARREAFRNRVNLMLRLGSLVW